MTWIASIGQLDGADQRLRPLSAINLANGLLERRQTQLFLYVNAAHNALVG